MKGKTIQGKHAQSVVRQVQRAAHKTRAASSAITVTFRHLEPSDAIRQYAERKLEHIGSRLKRSCSIHLILTVDKYRHEGEVTVKCGRFAVTAKDETKDLYEVIDRLADKVGRQLKSHFAKAATQRVRALSTGEVLSVAEDLDNGEGMIAGTDMSRF
ncbi:MAG TPA: ribosome-associated translation inhibitor RaiA [Candidatus Binataceae bacterium]|jgi:ribosomal subunit interface protein|nr:ribosome-associated translation inhibitor RaiA [Candidatus Binataceae bacterium]